MRSDNEDVDATGARDADRDGLEEVLAEEMPEALVVPEESGIDPESPALQDRLAEILAGKEDPALSPEEAAVHVTKAPPGAVDRDRDSYTGEPIP